MLHLIKWAIFTIITAASVVLAVANREEVTITLFPFPISIDLPLYQLIILILLVGILLGGLAMSSSVYKWRKIAKQSDKKTKELEREISDMRIDEKIRKEIPNY